MELIIEGSRGFRHLWFKSVVGFNPDCHCFHCLVGRRDPRVRPRMGPARLTVEEPGVTYFYLCGVAEPYVWENNLHLAVRREESSSCTAIAYNGLHFTVLGGAALPIPALPEGYQGLDKSFTTCRNFQFGVAYAEHLTAPQGELF